MIVRRKTPSQVLNAERDAKDGSGTNVNQNSENRVKCPLPQAAVENEMDFERFKMEDRMAGYDTIPDSLDEETPATSADANVPPVNIIPWLDQSPSDSSQSACSSSIVSNKDTPRSIQTEDD